MDYEKVCWYCGKKTACPASELGNHWFVCSDCGATYIKPSEVSAIALSKEHNDVTGGTKYKPRSIRRRNRPAVR